MGNLTFLGTGAADWFIENRDGFFRRNSAALINDELMIDCGVHIFDFADEDFYKNVENLIVTHNHGDHLSGESVRKLAEKREICCGCDKAVRERIGEHENINYIQFRPFIEYTLGKYKIIPVLANHDIVADGENYAFHYIIRTPEGKKIFYGADGAWFLRPTWEEMKKHKFDLMIFDCTVGDSDDWRLFEHNTIPMLRTIIKEIQNIGMLNDNGKLVATHLARTLHTTHEETEKILGKIGVVTAYDGLKINI